MLKEYYDLISDDKLPAGAKFVDPYDRHTFVVQDTQTLEDLTNLINGRREAKNLPSFEDKVLRQLIISAIYDSTPEAQLPNYFMRKTGFAGISSYIQLASTIMYEYMHSDNVSIEKRVKRAKNFCLNNCPFHSRNTSWASSAKKVVTKVFDKITSLDSVASYEEEGRLGTCSACGGCVLSAKNKASVSSVLVGTSPGHLEKMVHAWGENSFEKCWILKESLETTKDKTSISKKLAKRVKEWQNARRKKTRSLRKRREKLQLCAVLLRKPNTKPHFFSCASVWMWWCKCTTPHTLLFFSNRKSSENSSSTRSN